jgi:pyruvate,water dikinase
MVTAIRVPAIDELTFNPPGPGSWEVEADHNGRPVSRFLAEISPAAFAAGFSSSFRRYGSLLDTLDQVTVNDFGYMRIRPVGAPPDKPNGPPPPKLIMWALFRVHPELRRRVKTASRVFELKPWREELREWDEVRKPASIAKHKRLLAVDPETLDNQALLAYIGQCRDHLGKMIEQHHYYNATAMAPLGDFLAHASDWTGLKVADLMPLMRGATPLSAGRSPELTRLADAIRADATTLAALEGGADAAETLRELAAADGAIGEAARDYIALTGYRVIGYDIVERSNVELPEALLATLRGAVNSSIESETEGLAEDTARIRAMVPQRKWAQFDTLLAEARLCYRLRDERCLFSDALALGLARRALLAAGARMVSEGRLPDAALFLECSFAEMESFLTGSGGPSAEELELRAAFRAAYTFRDVPQYLGDPPSPPPPPESLPAGAQRLARALGMIMGNVFGETAKPEAGQRVLLGRPASDGVYEGAARIVRGPEDFDQVYEGDVLVTTATSPAFSVVLPLIGAVITERGGILSHAAIVAREYGIPAVVSCGGALAAINDGQRVRVDANAGEVTLLS